MFNVLFIATALANAGLLAFAMFGLSGQRQEASAYSLVTTPDAEEEMRATRANAENERVQDQPTAARLRNKPAGATPA